MKKTIFITRDIAPKNLKWQEVLQKYLLYGYSLINFSPVPFSLPLDFEWLFFYSKKGVQFFFEQIDNQVVAGKKIAVMGPGTGKSLIEQDMKVDFIGNGNPKETATLFLGIAQNKKVLFVRAENSKKSIQQLLSTDIQDMDLIVYKNEPKSSPILPFTDIAVLTSPLNAAVFLENYPFSNLPTLIAIGETTAHFLTNSSHGKVVVADSPSEEGILSTIRRL